MSLHKSIRLAVFERDAYRCRYCRRRWVDKVTREPIASYYDDRPKWCGGPHRVALLHVDHVVPRCKGGTDDLDNLVTACQTCNLTKYDNVWEPLPLEAIAVAS